MKIGRWRIVGLTLVFAVAFGLRLEAGDATCGAEAADSYRHLTDTQIVFGTITAWEPDAKCRGEGCLALPLIRINVDTAFRGQWAGEIVLAVPMPGAPYRNPEEVVLGTQVIMTFGLREETDEWFCGRLLSCDERPKQQLLSYGFYREYQWSPRGMP